MLVILGCIAAVLVYFAPQAVEGVASIALRLRNMSFVFTDPWWPSDPDGVGPFALSILVAAVAGGACSGALLRVGALSRARGIISAITSCIPSLSCFVAAPYYMSYLKFDRARDLIALDKLPFLAIAVFSQWLLLQNILIFKAQQRSMNTSLSTLAGSVLAMVVAVPMFFYCFSVDSSLHAYLYPQPH